MALRAVLDTDAGITDQRGALLHNEAGDYNRHIRNSHLTARELCERLARDLFRTGTCGITFRYRAIECVL